MALTNEFAFQPEMIIEIDDVLYAVFFDTDEEFGDFPILARVDSPNFIKEGTEIKEMDSQIFAATFGYAFRGHEDLLVSEILEGDATEYRTIFDVTEKKLETQAKEKGMSWILDPDVQAAFLAATLTGTPLSTDDLSETAWYKSSSPEQRDFMAKYYANPQQVENEIKSNISSITQEMISRNMKGPVDELARVLAYGVTTFTIKPDEVNQFLDYIDDPTYLDMIGGVELLPDTLQPFVGQFTGVNAGQSTTKGLIIDALGVNAYESMVQSGAFYKLAARVRAGDLEGVKEELQTQHDVLYPAFKGSNYGIWNGQFSNRASRVINGTTGGQVVKLTQSQQETVDDAIIEAKGDYNQFDKIIRTKFLDAPGVKNAFLADLVRALPQGY